MKGPPGRNNAPITVDVRVHHVDCEELAIFVNCGAQQLGDAAIQTQGKSREVSGAAVVETLLADSDPFNVTQAVEDGEGLAVLEHARAIVRQRRCGQDVELILYLDDVFQCYATSSCAMQHPRAASLAPHLRQSQVCRMKSRDR